MNLPPPPYNLKPRKGFSILELIITLGIFAVIVAAAMPIYNKLHISSGLKAAEAQFVQTLRIARERSVAGLGGMTYGVHITANGYTLYRSSVLTAPYDGTRDIPYDQTTTVDSSISLSPVNVAIIFSKSTGAKIGALTTITLTQTGGDVRAVTVNTAGLVSGGPPPSSVGSPILVITDTSKPFTIYLGEIMLAEGLNMKTTMLIGAVSASALAPYDTIILGDIDLTDAQVTIFTDWVNLGGRLIAMSPDVTAPGSLQSLLGLNGAACTTLSNAYWNIDTTVPPGQGIVTDTIQFHGDADNCVLSGATEVATLWSNISTSLSKPAVITRAVGSNGGQAAAFMFDLARSVVYTRQGNPLWAGDDRDGLAPKRGNDLFYGAKTGDVQPDWVNLANAAIPQADEAQRLLVNMIQNMLIARRPIPHFWYLPRGEKVALMMTGDDHNSNASVGFFDTLKTNSTPGCVIANWECFRATAWMYTGNAMTNAQAVAYLADGFEMGVHVSNGCADWDATSLPTAYDSTTPGDNSLPAFQAKYTGLPAQKTHRFHCIPWSDWSTHASVELARGIRLDENYYYWPSSWINNRPGFFTGSGFPMPFTDISGNILRNGSQQPIYQATTHLVNETGTGYPPPGGGTVVYPDGIDTMLDRALGTEGYYGILGTHYDADSFSTQLLNCARYNNCASAQGARAGNVRLITALQALDWTDGKNASSFSNVSWNPVLKRLSFTVTQDSRAVGLTTLVPSVFGGASVSAVRQNGSSLSFSTETIKGISYKRFLSTGGPYEYEVDYVADTTLPTAPTSLTTIANSPTQITLTWSGATDNVAVTRYRVERCQGSGCSAFAEIAQPIASPHQDTGLTANTFYRYRVQSEDGVGNLSAGYSPESEAQTTNTYTLWPSSTVPATPAFNDPAAVEVGVRFTSDIAGQIRGIRFYKGSTNTGTHTGHLWTNTDTLLGTVTFTGETASGWQEALFVSPITITVGTTYVASYHAPVGNYAVNSNYFTAQWDAAPLHAPAANNGIYNYGPSGTFPTLTSNATNYWVDVMFLP